MMSPLQVRKLRATSNELNIYARYAAADDDDDDDDDDYDCSLIVIALFPVCVRLFNPF